MQTAAVVINELDNSEAIAHYKNRLHSQPQMTERFQIKSKTFNMTLLLD